MPIDRWIKSYATFSSSWPSFKLYSFLTFSMRLRSEPLNSCQTNLGDPDSTVAIGPRVDLKERRQTEEKCQACQATNKDLPIFWNSKSSPKSRQGFQSVLIGTVRSEAQKPTRLWRLEEREEESSRKWRRWSGRKQEATQWEKQRRRKRESPNQRRPKLQANEVSGSEEFFHRLLGHFWAQRAVDVDPDLDLCWMANSEHLEGHRGPDLWISTPLLFFGWFFHCPS